MSARDRLPHGLYETLCKNFSPRQVEYIGYALTPGELDLIADIKDAYFIARIKKMSPERLERFDRFVPKDAQQLQFYQDIQGGWLRCEQYLLGTRLGRSPTHRELFIDFMNNHNGLRFKAYFAMKYPDRMRPQRKAS